MQFFGTEKKSCNLSGQKKITQPLRTKKITQPIGTKKSSHLSGQKNHATSWYKKKITQPLGTKKYPKNSNLSHKHNPGDRHRSPWSCIFVMLIEVNFSHTTLTTQLWPKTEWTLSCKFVSLVRNKMLYYKHNFQFFWIWIGLTYHLKSLLVIEAICLI